MKRYISLFMSVVMILSVLSIACVSTAAYTCDGFDYVILPDLTAEIKGYGKDADSITIPEKVGEYTVSSIGGFAFSYREDLKEVVIPDTVENISSRAFTDCTALEKVTIPDSVTFIGENAFYNTKWFVDQPQGAVYINNVLYDYKGEIPANTTLKVKDGTVSIMEYIFNGDSAWGIVDLDIPDSVTYISGNTFYGTQWFNDHPDGPVYAGKVLYDYKGKMPANTKLEIKDGTVAISDNVFENYSDLKEITIPDSVKSIGYEAFASCTGLTKINLPDSVTSIAAEAFSWCKNLKTITLGNSLESIGDSAFLYCNALEEVVIPKSIVSMGHDVFSGCESLRKVDIKGDVPVIGRNAFSNCTSLDSIRLPQSVKIVDKWAFMGCTSLSEIELSDNIDYVGNNAFGGTKWLDNQPDGLVYINDVLYCYKGAMPENTVINIKDTTKSITASAFYMCDNLLEVIIPDSVTAIGEYTFYGCSDLKKVEIPESVKTIGTEAFSWCDSLSQVTIPSSVELIEGAAFAYCDKLDSITILNPDCEIVPFIEEASIIRTIPQNATICGYAGSTAQAYAEEYGNKLVLLGKPDPNRIYGDADGDGEVSVLDATAIQLHIASLKIMDTTALGVSDTDDDGDVSILDATQIQLFIAQLIPEL